ncbi:LpxI family protein [Pelagimonas varians]|uniref:LpxI family protein n=1 Tax=Pelagimonas varians TaxID=696760 RepID=UPI000BEF1280|nr:UDP-2,3-diacylglucosamine diphosphatase LpxI [Pelagimonas varians]
MLALIAGQGALPKAVASAMPTPPLICALKDVPPSDLIPDHVFRLERLGGLFRMLKAHGVTQVCMCGSISRPDFDWRHLDFATLRLLPSVLRGLRRGDDGALRIAIRLFENAGFEVLAAHDAVPDLLPDGGVPTLCNPTPEAESLATLGDNVSEDQSRQDLGQACIVARNGMCEREDDDGTDALLNRVGQGAKGGILYKAPKPGQDRRADLPVIGPATARGAAQAGLAGIVIEANGVMVLNFEETLRRLDAEGLFLWIRERPV